MFRKILIPVVAILIIVGIQYKRLLAKKGKMTWVEFVMLLTKERKNKIIWDMI